LPRFHREDRLIHHDDPRAVERGEGEKHPLGFPLRERRKAAGTEVPELEGVHNVLVKAFVLGTMPAGHIHVLEEVPDRRGVALIRLKFHILIDKRAHEIPLMLDLRG
jgi:hypothetical protein